MTYTKFDYTKSCEDIFWKVIYPLFPKEFMFWTNYEHFATVVSDTFILNVEQWEHILEHWETKEAKRNNVTIDNPFSIL